MRHPVDGRLHFSELKAHAKSPAHVKLAVEGARTLTRSMLVGGIADSMVFEHGEGHALYEGKRDPRSKDWLAFKEANAGRYLCIASELEEAMGAANAVLQDPVATEVLAGCDFQQVMQWDAFGLPCAAGVKGERGGFDALHRDRRYIADLKVTQTTEPEAFSRHVLNMHWHVQLAWYRIGARTLGQPIDSCKIIGVEAQPPHNVTILRIPERWLIAGEQLIHIWTEKHRACEEANAWPGYVQSEIEAIEPAWMAEGPELEGLDDA